MTTMTHKTSNKYTPYVLSSMDDIHQLEKLPESRRVAMRAVASVLPFRTNSYVTDELIDWDDIPGDPMF
jgi:L-lysine 2,3-aminomutase